MQSLYVCHVCKLYPFNVRRIFFSFSDLLVNRPKSRNTSLIFIKERSIFRSSFLIVRFQTSPAHRLMEYPNIVSLRQYLSWAWPLLPEVSTSVFYACMRGAQPNMADTGRTTRAHVCHPVYAWRCGWVRVHASCVSTYIRGDMWTDKSMHGRILCLVPQTHFCAIDKFLWLFHLDNASFTRNIAYNFAEARPLDVAYIKCFFYGLMKDSFPFHTNYINIKPWPTVINRKILW